MKTSFSSFTIENNLKEIEKALNAYGYEIEDKELKSKFEEVDKLLAVRESLTEAYEVGLLNVKYLSGESVNSSDYANAILKIERGDHDKLVKHYNYNLTKLYKAKNDLVGIVDDITVPSASMESYQSSIHGYNVSVEGIGDVFNKIGEKIKKAWEYIIEKMKKFFNWITGKSSEADETSNAASTATVPEKLKGESGESIDKKKEQNKQVKGDKENEPKVLSEEEYIKARSDAFTAAYNALTSMPNELTEDNIVQIAKPFVDLGIGSKVVSEIKSKCKDTKQGVITTGTGTKKTNIEFISKAKTYEWLQQYQKETEDSRSGLQKVYDKSKEFGGKVFNGVVSIFTGFKKENVESKGSAGKDSDSGNKAPKDDSVSAYGYKYHEIKGVENVYDQRDIIDSCKNYIIKNTSAKTFLAMEIIGSGKTPAAIGEKDITHLLAIFDKLSKAVNGYADGFNAALDRAVKSNIAAQQAEQGAKEASTNPNKNTPNKPDVNKAKKGLKIDVRVDEETAKTIGGLVGDIVDKNATLDTEIRRFLTEGRYVIVDKNRVIQENAAGGSRIFKGFGSQLDKVIVIDLPDNKTKDNLTLEDISPSEVILDINKDKEDEVHRILYSIPSERLVSVVSNLKSNADKLKNSISIAKSNFEKTTNNLTKLKNIIEGKAKNDITLDISSVNQVSKFLMGGMRLASIVATSIANRRDCLSHEMQVIMAYSNYLGKSIEEAVNYQIKERVNSAFGDIDNLNTTIQNQNQQQKQ